MKSLVRLGALLAIAGLALTACGGGGGGGTPPTPTPTSTPPPSVAQELCPASGALPQAAAARTGGSSSSSAHRLPSRALPANAVPDLLAVTYESKNVGKTTQSIRPDELNDAERMAGATALTRSFSFDRLGVHTHVVRVAPEQLQRAMSTLRSQPGVKSVSLVHYRRALSATAISVNDPYYNGFSANGPPGPAPYFETKQATATQLGGHGQWNMHVIDVGQAWGYSQQGFGGAIDGAPIAIIDTGFDLTHPELANGKVKRAFCYVTYGGYVSSGPYVTDFDGHGTDVAGYASADTSNNIGFAGVGFNTPLLLYRAFPTPPNDPNNGCDSTKYKDDPRCSLTTSDEVAAINDAVQNGAKVISLSLGASNSGGSCVDTSEENAIENAISNNVVVVAAAGNETASALDCPAAYPHVIAVGASALDDSTSTIVERVASYSNYDAAHASTWGLVAPGGDPDAAQSACSTSDCIDWLQWIYGIYSSTAYQSATCAGDYPTLLGPSDCRILIAGTSMATPHVAGAVALMLGVKPSLTPAQVAQMLCSTADNINDPKQGCGRLNVYHAVAAAVGDPNP